MSRQPAWVGRTTSRVSCRWHWNPSWVCNPSRRCKKTRRERSLGHRSSVSVAAARIARARRRQAQDGRKGIGIISNHFVPAFDLPFGPWSQKLDHIGASGIIVIRIPKWSPARSALAALPRRAAKKDAFQIWFHTHDCSSHLGGPAEPGGATREPRGRDLKYESYVREASQGPYRCLCARLDVRGEARMVAMRRRKQATLGQLNGVIACRF